MPFRSSLIVRKQLDQLRRTGEPSPAKVSEYLDLIDREKAKGFHMAEGSFTETMRKELWRWMKTNYGSSLHPLTFEYKLSRKKKVVIVGERPFIRHTPLYGKGVRGFLLVITILSVDGVPYVGMRRTTLAWSRIIGKERFLSLPSSSMEVSCEQTTSS